MMEKPPVADGEWISSKKVVNHKTRQVETRIQRQLIMEDGKVIADSGPQVTIRTKEDNWTEESENSAKKGIPIDVKSIESMVKSPKSSSSPSPSIPIKTNDETKNDKELIISEKIETKNTTREDKHERFQYHDESISELTGFDIHQKALVSPNDLITINCDVINVEKDVDIDQIFNGDNNLPPKGKLTHFSSKSHKVTDKEEVKEISKLGPDGEITKETVRTSHHEEVSDDEQPEGKEEEKSENKSNIEDKVAEISKKSSSSSSPSSKITYSQNATNPITSLPSKAKPHHHNVTHHHRHLDDDDEHHHHPIYDITGKADHTNKWIESHFGSSDSSQHDVNNKEIGLNSSSSGSIVDRRGRPRQRINPAMSQSYDEAYYSNTNGGNQSQSNNSSSKLTSAASDKLDCSISSPSPPIGKRYQQQFNKQKQINSIGFTKFNGIGNKSTNSPYSFVNNNHNNNNSPSESSVSSYIHDYHHSSEGSLSPSILTTNQQNQVKKLPINKQLSSSSSSSYHLANCKPVKSTINSNGHNNNSRNLIIKVKHRVPKEDASVQASLSDEEIDHDHFKENTNYGKQSINLDNNGFKDLNNNNLNRPRPIKTYYFGEPVQSDFPVNQELSSTVVNHKDNLNYYRLPVDDLHGSKSINQGYLIEKLNSPVNHDYNDDEKFSRSLNCLSDQRIVNGTFDKLFDRSSRTDLFQTRDYGSLSNWRSTINLRSDGLTKIDRSFNGNRSKDDSYSRDYNNNYIPIKPNYRDSLNRVTLRKGHLGSVNNLMDNQYKVDQTNDHKSRGLSPIQERKGSSLALDNNLNLLLSRGSSYWPELNQLKSSINHPNNYNPKGTYKVNNKNRTPVQTYYFKAN